MIPCSWLAWGAFWFWGSFSQFGFTMRGVRSDGVGWGEVLWNVAEENVGEVVNAPFRGDTTGDENGREQR